MPPSLPRQPDSDDRTRRFIQLFSEHDRRLKAFVFAMVRNWNDAEELLQETRIRLWEQFDQYDPEKDFGAWSRTIAYYQILTHRKKIGREKARYTTEFMDAIAEEMQTQSPELDRRQSALQSCLEKMDEAKRDTLMRYYAGAESMREIADSLNRPFEGFRKSILRTRLALGKCVNSALEGEQ